MEIRKTVIIKETIEVDGLGEACAPITRVVAMAVRHGRYITFQLAEVAIPGRLFANILRLVDGPRPAPLPP